MHDDSHVILRFRDGRTERATIVEIDSATETVDATRDADGTPEKIAFTDLKAVFFPRTEPEDELGEQRAGSLIAVEFADGEVIRGTATYNPEASGFFLYPLDRSKNERIFVVRSAIASLEVEKL
jgi:hypothetical protein